MFTRIERGKIEFYMIKKCEILGMVLLACNPSSQEAKAKRCGFEPSLDYIARTSLMNDYTNKCPNKTLKVPIIV